MIRIIKSTVIFLFTAVSRRLKLIIVSLFVVSVVLVAFSFFLGSVSTQPLLLEKSKVATDSAVLNQSSFLVNFNEDSTFTPKSITVKTGDTVAFKNNSKETIRIAMGKHENHVTLSGFTVAELAAGEVYRFWPKEAGKFEYHNDLKAKEYGELIIE